ncbi:MAG: hypothetical protein V4702_02960 [Patescibacteria group bacterium]
MARTVHPSENELGSFHIPGSDMRQALILGEQGGYNLDLDPQFAPGAPDGSLIARDINTIFDLHGFEEPRMPYVVGEADFSQVLIGTKYNSVPLKFPGSEYRVPKELACIRYILELCASHEQGLNPRVDEFYAYLSLQRSEVIQGQRQNSGGLHSDGLQGRRIQPKVMIEHGYSATDRDPTLFFPQVYDMDGVDIDTHWMDDVFAGQTDREKRISFAAGQVTVFDAYCVHQAVPATSTGPRTFFKLTFANRQYDRAGNTINLLFADEYLRESWAFGPRSMPLDLICADGSAVGDIR